MITSYSTLVAVLIVGALPISSSSARAQPLETLNTSYASVTGSRIPLWIAKDAGLFEKQGLHVNLVVIAAGNAAIGALAGGAVEIGGASINHNHSRVARQDGWYQPSGYHHRIRYAARAAEAWFRARKGCEYFGHGSCRVEQAAYDHASGQDRCDPGESGQSL